MEDYKLDISFPPLPSTVAQVGELIASRKTDTDALIDIVKHDPAVSVNVLRRVNSAYYGVQRDVESIDQAVRLLGFVEVTSLTLIEGMNRMRNRFSPYPQLFGHIFRAAVFTGRFTQKIAEALNLARRWTRLSFTSGMISETGRLVLVHATPDQYAKLVDELDVPLPSADQERQEFGESHREIAPRACLRWGLPERICSVLHLAKTVTEASGGSKRCLAVAIRGGSILARQDAADEPFVPPEGIRELAMTASTKTATENLALKAAEDASAYSREVGNS